MGLGWGAEAASFTPCVAWVPGPEETRLGPGLIGLELEVRVWV